MKNDFYIINCMSEDNVKFVEFGVRDTDDYAEVDPDTHELIFVPDDASDDFKKFLHTFFKGNLK
jgi:hypothetical protein